MLLIFIPNSSYLLVCLAVHLWVFLARLFLLPLTRVRPTNPGHTEPYTCLTSSPWTPFINTRAGRTVEREAPRPALLLVLSSLFLTVLSWRWFPLETDGKKNSRNEAAAGVWSNPDNCSCVISTRLMFYAQNYALFFVFTAWLQWMLF